MVVCVTGGVTHTLTSEGADASEDGTGRGVPIITPTLTAALGSNCAAPGDSNKDQLIAAAAAAGAGVRRLTPLECERLQGFPDGHTAGQSDAQRYRQLGNAVAVPVVEWIARRLVQEIDTC